MRYIILLEIFIVNLQKHGFEIISLNNNSVLVEGKLCKKCEVVKTILTDIAGVAYTSADLLHYRKYCIEKSKAPKCYLTDGAKPIEFEIIEDGKSLTLQGQIHQSTIK